MAHDSELHTAKAQLLDDFDKVVRDTEALLRSLANVSGEKAVALRDQVEANLNTAKARLRDLHGEAMDRAKGAARDADEYVHDNPWTAIGVAAAAGVILGLVIGTRR
jgi:ElaB/YqjD/DUF883 family membrane-anchored ribosome-binding protein